MTLEVLHIHINNELTVSLSVRHELLLAHVMGHISSERLVMVALNEAPEFLEVKDIQESDRT